MAAKKAEEAEFLLAEHTRKEQMEKEKAERDRLAAEVIRRQSEVHRTHPHRCLVLHPNFSFRLVRRGRR